MIISTIQKVTLSGALAFNENGSVTCDAYDVLGPITVEGGASDMEVEVTPASPEQLNLIMIMASAYEETVPGTADITYKPGADSSAAVQLDNAHMYVGKGQIATLEAAPAKLFFSNANAADLTVTVIVGRNATP